MCIRDRHIGGYGAIVEQLNSDEAGNAPGGDLQPLSQEATDGRKHYYSNQIVTSGKSGIKGNNYNIHQDSGVDHMFKDLVSGNNQVGQLGGIPKKNRKLKVDHDRRHIMIELMDSKKDNKILKTSKIPMDERRPKEKGKLGVKSLEEKLLGQSLDVMRNTNMENRYERRRQGRLKARKIMSSFVGDRNQTKTKHIEKPLQPGSRFDTAGAIVGSKQSRSKVI